ncbi:MAG TPA: Kiwa anti-phage protein KwaB-like domain-containing protein [Candidatus Saccharimonadales bacterium]|nr:Kiwa anti-phage protein KwaB-like domain-containing protein [Candidatus Saccharimonadales bacterium]
MDDNELVSEEQPAAEEQVLQNETATEVPAAAKADNYVQSDVFAWANNLVQYVDDLKIDLYLFNRNFTVYRTKIGGEVYGQLRPLFLDEVLEYILGGIDLGLIVRDFEEAEKEELVLQRTRVKNVEKLVYTLDWLKTQATSIEEFKEEEHDLKRIKGVIAKCSHKDFNTFYLIKNVPASQIMKGPSAWLLKDNIFKPFDKMTALKIPPDNQLLVVDQDLYVFNQSKLKSLFGYDAKAASIARKKVEEIEANFKLSFAEGANLQSLVKGKPAIIKKLQNVEPSLVKQNDLTDHAEDIGVELMLDDDGSIIIMDDKDLARFVNLLNDDYMESNMTGQRYEIIKKRLLKQNSEETI